MKRQQELLAAGLTRVFAAGNAGGTGSQQQTSTQCVLQEPGNVCVANYNDFNTGMRDAALDPSSSRGQRDDPETWPGLSAPGTHVTPTCRLTLPVCWPDADHEPEPPNSYAAMSGMSMAAPHGSGVAALLYQVDPDLTPGEVDWVLEETAHKFSFGAATSPTRSTSAVCRRSTRATGWRTPSRRSRPCSTRCGSPPRRTAQPSARPDGQRAGLVRRRGDDHGRRPAGRHPRRVRRGWSHTIGGLAPGERTVTVS